MRWEDERYVRLYTRNTVDWHFLSFEAQGLLCLLLRVVDRAGLLPLGRHGRKGVAAAIGHPARAAEVEKALSELVADGCVQITDDGAHLLIPNFIEAQEATASDKARQAKARETARDIAAAKSAGVTIRDGLSQNVTESHKPSRAVTDSHAASQAVTPNRAVPSVPSRAEPTEEEKASAAPPPAPLQPAFAWLKQADQLRAEAFPSALQDAPESGRFLAWWKQATAQAPPDVLLDAYRVFLCDPWAGGLAPPAPWSAWQKQWGRFVPGQNASAAATKPKRSANGF